MNTYQRLNSDLLPDNEIIPVLFSLLSKGKSFLEISQKRQKRKKQKQTKTKQKTNKQKTTDLF